MRLLQSCLTELYVFLSRVCCTSKGAGCVQSWACCWWGWAGPWSPVELVGSECLLGEQLI